MARGCRELKPKARGVLFVADRLEAETELIGVVRFDLEEFLQLSINSIRRPPAEWGRTNVQ